MALSEGGSMSTYGKTIYNPHEESSQWIEQIKREEKQRKNHNVVNGDDTVVATYFKGKKPDPGPDPAKNISYYNNYKERPTETLYERTFKVDLDYEPKLHRDDRHHKVGLDLHSEDKGKGVSTIRSNSVYGARIHAPIDKMGVATTHAKRQIVAEEFFDHGPEDVGKSVFVRSSSVYGKRTPFDPALKEHVRVQVTKQFFRGNDNR